MYKEYFGLKEIPFSIAPDPRYLFMSEKHREALAHLLYGINCNGGFVLLTGEVGTGKTTICRCLLDQIPDNSDIAFILNPKLTSQELLAAICDELEIVYPTGTASVKVLVDLINSYLLKAHSQGRKTVLIIEEAQNLAAQVLEQIRLLTNLETNQQKLLQIVMIGQPELREMLARTDMRQLSQRITARYHLRGLSKEEVAAYVRHRLDVAGAKDPVFPPTILRRLYRLSKGIPRIINLLSDRAMLGAYVQGKKTVDRRTLAKASREVFGEEEAASRQDHVVRWASIILALAFSGVALAAAYYGHLFEPLLPREVRAIPQRPVSTTLQWPAGVPISQSETLAYGALFRQWGVSLKDAISPCGQARTHGLECLDGSGSMGRLLQWNRPAVLKLLDGSGRDYYATLIAVRGLNADFLVGGEKRTVDIKEVEMRWMGDYSILWERPPHYKGEIHPGASGPEVLWLDKQLAILQGLKAREGKTLTYDAALLEQVKKFQISRGLMPDGIVGPRTVVELTADSGNGRPRLAQGQGQR